MKLFIRKKLVAESRNFVVGYKCLTTNGKKRISKLQKALGNYKETLKDLNNIDFINSIEDGLIGFAGGTEGGFNQFESNKTIEKLIYIINKKGRL